MRKTLLFAAALCLASTTAMAQTYANPLQIQTGDNTCQASEPATYYWKFVADDNYIATIGQYGDSETPMVAIESNGRPSYINGVTASDYVSKIFALEKGKTYYFTINAETKGEIGFSLKLDKTENLGAGLSTDKPVEIKVGTTQVLGNPCYPEDTYDDVNVYTTYKAEKDGQLQIKTEQYVSSAKVDGTAISAETVNGKRVFKINTKAGNTYAINFTLGIPFFIATSEVVEVKEGAIDMPYVMKEGENSIPAEAGKYFFTYKPTKKGFLNITSDAQNTDGQISIYRNKFNADSGNNAVGKSATGSYNVRTEIESIYYTYYIVVDKKSATANAETFKCKMEDYQPGETADTAIPIEVSDVATKKELLKAKGTFYYSIKIPANTDKLLVVESATDLSEGTTAYVNTLAGSTYGCSKMENKIIKRDVKNTVDKTYYLTVVSNEEKPLTFTFSLVDAAEGSLITNPKKADAGNNTIDFNGTEYYTYTATKSGKLAIEVGDGAKVTFPLSATGYGVNDTYQKGNTYFIQATKGEEYLITISDVKKGSTFNLAETDFEAGELKSNPIVMTEDTYTLGENTGNLWLKYKVTQSGVIDLACDVPFNDDFFLGVIKNSAQAPTSMADDIQDENTLNEKKPQRIKKYQSTFEVSSGDILYIQASMPGDVKGKKITLTQRAPEAGESINNPIVLKQGETINVAKASLMKPIWVKANLIKGDNTFQVADGYITPICNCKSGDGITYEGNPVVWDESGTKFSTYSSKADEFVFMIGYAEGNATLTFIDSTANGINNIDAANDGKMSIFTLDGRKIDQINSNGIYIIKSNGTTKKVVIKK